MLVAQFYVPAERTAEASGALDATGRATHIVALGRTMDSRLELVNAEVDPQGIEEVMAALLGAGVDARDITVHQLSPLRPVAVREGAEWFGADPGDFVWMQLIGQARRNARIIGRFMAFMIIAGVVAAFGVIERNGILIVGAMALSPDLLPVCAACVGVVGRRFRLVGRALVSLVLGLLLASTTAALLTLLLRAVGDLDGFHLGEGGLGLLTTVNYSTVGIALAAGIAAILAFETNATAAVGVAISVTTIPAAAYMGVSLITGGGSLTIDALEVLLVNVGLLLVAGSLTLTLQRLLHRTPVKAGVPGQPA